MDLKISTRHQPQTTKAEIQIPMIPIQTVFLQQINQPSFPFHHFILTSSPRFLPVGGFCHQEVQILKKNMVVFLFFFAKKKFKKKKKHLKKLPKNTTFHQRFFLPMINLLVRFVGKLNPSARRSFVFELVEVLNASWKQATKNAKSEGRRFMICMYIYIYIYF